MAENENVTLESANTRKRILVAAALATVAFVLNTVYLTRGAHLTVLRVTEPVAAGNRLQATQVSEVVIKGEDLDVMRKLFVASEHKEAFLAAPLAESLSPGQLLTQRAFRLEGQTRLVLRDKERGMSFKVRDDSSAVLCFIGPGSTVDVWAPIRAGEVALLLRGATVLALGDAIGVARPGQCQDARYSNVTLAVAEVEVQKVLQSLDAARGEVRVTVVGAGPAQSR